MYFVFSGPTDPNITIQASGYPVDKYLHNCWARGVKGKEEKIILTVVRVYTHRFSLGITYFTQPFVFVYSPNMTMYF